jgi:hypothetical protein
LGQRFSFRPDWDEREGYPRELDEDFPEFRYGWNGLRIVVVDARGKAWRSMAASYKPAWFELAPPPGDVMDWLSEPAPTVAEKVSG